jgi:hypothetical protein
MCYRCAIIYKCGLVLKKFCKCVRKQVWAGAIEGKKLKRWGEGGAGRGGAAVKSLKPLKASGIIGLNFSVSLHQIFGIGYIHLTMILGPTMIVGFRRIVGLALCLQSFKGP